MIVREFNEFTWDMVRALPKVYYYYAHNTPCEVHCKPGLVSLYKPFSSKVRPFREFSEDNDPETYEHERPSWTKKEWLPPPLKELWKNRLSFSKPVLVIQNKYSLEWGRGAFNYFPLDVLEEIFDLFVESHTVIYIRPKGREKNFYKDQNAILRFKDYKLIREKYHNKVLTIKDFWWRLRGLDFNQRQFAIHACADRHITVSGGNACLAAYFGGDILMYDSKEGDGAGRGVWKTDSWLKELSGAYIHSFNCHEGLVNKSKEIWLRR
ncbi:MAG: hypothetical protein PHP44_07930 [Kiritimatiellae bacterium]|nr:hypothetical protein [Kiritimatiellia bacterium]